MKKMILAVTTLALTGASVQNVSAGDREWATAGKVLTGLFAARVVADVLAPPRVYTYEAAPVYAYQPQVVYATPQVVTAAPVIQNAPMVPPAPTVPSAPASTVVVPAGTVTYQPAPVYVQQPAPTVVYAAPVYAPPPVVYYGPAYCPPPYYYRPGISVGFSFGHGGYRHGRW